MKSIHQFADLLARDDIYVNNLGCVMLPVEDIMLIDGTRKNFLDPEDLYTSPDPEKFWIKGDVTHKAHVTLLYGLLAPAYEIKEFVDAVLEDWERPWHFDSPEVVAFDSPTPDTEPYKCIVAKVMSPELIEAHQRLSFLPHVNTHPEYQPHITLAYVKEDKAEHWVDVLNFGKLEFLVKDGPLDYGENRD